MIERYLLQILGILSLGDFIGIKSKLIPIKKQNLPDRIVVAIIVGYASFVFPMIFISFAFDDMLDKVVYLHYALSMIVLLWQSLRFFNKFDYDKLNLKISFSNETILLIAIFGIMLDYLLIVMIYPERGWDALHYYFPNGLYFYLIDDITAGLNPFSFYPTFKPPINVLYITYSFYVARGMYAQLHAWTFLLGTVLVVYQLGEKISHSKIIALLSSLFFLTFPLTYFLVYEYSFYQELPLLFFYSAGMYFFWESRDGNKSKSLIGSLACSLAILSKISGYSFLLILFLIFPVKYFHKILRLSLLLFVIIFLSYKALFDFYWGISVLVIALGFILFFLIVTENPKFRLPRFTYLVLIIPIIVGIAWTVFMLKIPAVEELLLDTYIRTGGGSISKVYPGINDPSLAYLENGMRISFTSSILYFFTGSMFALSLLPFKINGIIEVFKKREKLGNFLLSWWIAYSIIWYAYFGSVSARYLVPILVPLSIITAIGFVDILNKFKISENDLRLSIIALIVIFSVFLFYYPFIPIEYANMQFNERIFRYHKYQFKLLIYATIISLLFLMSIRFIKKVDDEKLMTIIRVLLFIFIITPVSPQVYILAASDFDQEEFQAQAAYYNRPEYQELISAIKELNIDLEQKIISVNTPGLGYYVLRPAIDLMLFESDLSSSIQLNNASKLMELMVDNDIILVVKLNFKHVYYQQFIKNYASLVLFQITVDGNNFSEIFRNSEFILFERISEVYIL